MDYLNTYIRCLRFGRPATELKPFFDRIRQATSGLGGGTYQQHKQARNKATIALNNHLSRSGDPRAHILWYDLNSNVDPRNEIPGYDITESSPLIEADGSKYQIHKMNNGTHTIGWQHENLVPFTAALPDDEIHSIIDSLPVTEQKKADLRGFVDPNLREEQTMRI